MTASLLRRAGPAAAIAAAGASAPVAPTVAGGRVGIIVPKHKHSSVERNRLKRRLRELARTLLLPGLPPVDLVVRTFPESYDASFDTLEREVQRVRERLRRLHATGAAE